MTGGDREDIVIEWKKRSSLIEELLVAYLPGRESYGGRVIEAMEYSLLAGGKRLRPILMLESYRLFGGEREEDLHPFLVAIEMIHTYSLVHDDLPAMDNDLYRRGKKTTHAIYGPGMATLAGDGLLNCAFETVLSSLESEDKTGLNTRRIRALRVMAEKAGVHGMVGGQSADLEAEGRVERTREELLYIHEHKTAALIEASLMMGGILAGASAEEVALLERIGSRIGLAFQIRDDVLDVTGSVRDLGKEVGQDLRNDKMTYVSLYGQDKAQRDLEELSQEAIKDLSRLGRGEGFLFSMIAWLTERNQ